MIVEESEERIEVTTTGKGRKEDESREEGGASGTGDAQELGVGREM